MKCVVRDQFVFHQNGQVFHPGEIVDWDEQGSLPAPLEIVPQVKKDPEPGPEKDFEAHPPEPEDEEHE